MRNCTVILFFAVYFCTNFLFIICCLFCWLQSCNKLDCVVVVVAFQLWTTTGRTVRRWSIATRLPMTYLLSSLLSWQHCLWLLWQRCQLHCTNSAFWNVPQRLRHSEYKALIPYTCGPWSNVEQAMGHFNRMCALCSGGAIWWVVAR